MLQVAAIFLMISYYVNNKIKELCCCWDGCAMLPMPLPVSE